VTARAIRQSARPWYIAAGIAISLVFAGPLCWEVFRSLEPDSLLTAAPSRADLSHLGLSNYRTLLSGGDDIIRNVGNSLVVALGTAALTAAVATLAGYGFGRLRFRGSGILFGVVLVALMVPFQAVLTPLFLEMHYLRLLNSLLGLALFYTAHNLPFGVYVMRNTFRQLPEELIEAASVDGASPVAAFWRVLRPLVVPGMATAALYAFLFAWTEFLAALTLVTNGSLYTLPVALDNVELGTYGSLNIGLLCAGAVVAMVPCVLVYVALQRYYVQGLLSGAVKG
jgi:multiple sugar transport system permease protein